MRNYITDVIAPLTDETQELFKPLHLSKGDTLHIDTDFRGWFHIQAKKHTWIYRDGKDKRVTTFASSDAATQWLQRVPEKTSLSGYGEWAIASTDFNAILIHTLFGPNQIVWESEEAHIKYQILLLRFIQQNSAAKERAIFKSSDLETKKQIAAEILILDHGELPLMPLQKVAVKGALNQVASHLFMEQGTGKTPIIVSRICNEAKDHTPEKMYRAIVVCPKNVRYNWLSHFVQFSTVPGKVVILNGDKLSRLRQIIQSTVPDGKSKWTVIVCSYGTLVKSWEFLDKLKYDLAVADESHFFKNTKTQRYKTILKLREVSRQRTPLTGTPITNHLEDLYAQLEFMDAGMSGFTKFSAFKKFYAKYIKESSDGFERFISYCNVPLIQERLLRTGMTVTKKEALPELPEKTHSVESVDMSPEQAKFYKTLQEQLAIEIENDIAVGEKAGLTKAMIVNNSLVKMLKLAQITSGFLQFSDMFDEYGNRTQEKHVDHLDPNPKLERLVTMVQESNRGTKVIIWACWVPSIKTIAARLRLEGFSGVTYYGATTDKARIEAERAFNNDPNCKFLVGNPSAGGVGLNLHGFDVLNPDASQTNADLVIYYACNWSMVHRSQSEDRSHRKGTRVPIAIVDLCVPGSIDTEIRDKVTSKRKSAMEIQDCKEIMARLLDFKPSEVVSTENGESENG